MPTGNNGGGHPNKLTAEKKAKFLEALRENGGVIADACRTIRAHRETVYYHRKNDPEFAKGWTEALDDGIDVIEDVGRKLATKGEAPLIALMLKGRRFIERHEVTGKDGAPLSATVVYIPENSRKKPKKKNGENGNGNGHRKGGT